MKSFTTPDFWQAYAALPRNVREQARKAYQIWQDDQSHPSLYFNTNFEIQCTAKSTKFHLIEKGFKHCYEMISLRTSMILTIVQD